VRKPLVLGALLLVSGCSLSICAPEPIEGYWTSAAGAVVHMTKSGSGFEGVVVQKRNQGDCPEPVGDVLFKLQGSGQHYTGQWQWWRSPACDRRFANNATVDLKNSSNTAHVCSKDPFDSASGGQCLDFTRVKNFKPSASPR